MKQRKKTASGNDTPILGLGNGEAAVGQQNNHVTWQIYTRNLEESDLTADY
jgi:hypothetical protein